MFSGALTYLQSRGVMLERGQLIGVGMDFNGVIAYSIRFPATREAFDEFFDMVWSSTVDNAVIDAFDGYVDAVIWRYPIQESIETWTQLERIAGG